MLKAEGGLAEQPEDRLDYQGILKEALRDAVRRVLARVAEHGLPGEHYFYIAFRTDHPGVEAPSFLRERYPDEMTVVLQHQFWDLEVTPEAFSVRLNFSASRYVLRIPFAALTAFIDPSADFALRFEGSPAGGASTAPADAGAKGGGRAPGASSVSGASGAVSEKAAGKGAARSSGKTPRRATLVADTGPGGQRGGTRGVRSAGSGGRTLAAKTPASPVATAAPVDIGEKSPAPPAAKPEKEPPGGGKSGDVIRFDPSRRR
jgi:hypothetical protein